MKSFFSKSPLLFFLALFYSLFTVLSFLKVAYLKSSGIRFETRPWTDIIVNMYLFDWLSVMGFMLLVDYTIKYSIKKKMNWALIYSLHLGISLVFGFFISAFLIFVRSVSPATKSMYSFDIEMITQYFFNNMEYLFLIYFSMTSICYAAHYFKLIGKEKLSKLQIENEYLNAQTQLLQNQIQPHFLFNVLNNVSYLIDTDATRSKNMLSDLREFIERTLKLNKAKFISAQKEMMLTDSYLKIVENKYGPSLKILKNISENDIAFFVPPLIFQPLIENALKHGFNGNELTIEILLLLKDENVHLKIINNGNLLKEGQDELFGKGIGLENIKKRLKYYFGDNYLFSIFNDEFSQKVVAHIRMPLVRQISLPNKKAKKPVFELGIF